MREHQIYEYIISEVGQNSYHGSLALIKAAYYLVPNFSAFDYSVHAVYALDIPGSTLLLTFVYMLTYTAILVGLAVWSFNRRQLP